MAPGSFVPTGMGPGPQIPHAVLVQQKQGSAIMIWAIGAFVNSLWLDAMFADKAYSFCIFGWELLLCLPREYKRIWTKSINVCLTSTSRWCFLWNWSIDTSAFKRLICWCVWLCWIFFLNPDWFNYPTFQLTDILRYFSKFWLSCICALHI